MTEAEGQATAGDNHAVKRSASTVLALICAFAALVTFVLNIDLQRQVLVAQDQTNRAIAQTKEAVALVQRATAVVARLKAYCGLPEKSY